ncbi:hypothetical protein [Granulicella sp. dw_53]|uniref:hypothetical protein n=1 Tax=Granulicella sp. dw_53 TaxID=2719792 RepID=UPI002104218F|nr:hypothetical protein [Granulicella sp. dw_53]
MKCLLRPFAVLLEVLLFLCLCVPFDAAQTAQSTARADTSSPPIATVTIPGPLRSFMRLASISQKVSPEDVLPLLARNIYMQGYRGGVPTEYLILLDRYVHQARELQILAGSNNTIRVASCDDAGTLVQILGYRLRQGCGQKNVLLETANPERAFLTIDSGFPLTELEEALQSGTPFTYPYPATQVPALYRESDWVSLNAGERRTFGNLLDILLSNPSIARLYWALTKNDAETSVALQRSVGLRKLLPFAPTLDFYGSQICIRSGRVITPGAPATDAAWKDLVGASPDAPGDFVTHLLAKDVGWLAAYFDVLARVNRKQQVHLTEGPRLKHLYEAFRDPDLDLTATRGVFRKAPDLLVLFTRLEWQPDGELRVPGGLEVWKDIFQQKSNSKTVHDWAKRARSWNQPEQLLEGMTALSRVENESGPVRIYLTLSELDKERSPENRLSAETVRLLANKFSEFGDWYLVFSEFPDLNDASISRFLTLASSMEGISNLALRGNALGTFQANVGLWQILARQGEIPSAQINASWQKMMEPFARISSPTQLFDAVHASLGEILLASSGKPNRSQDEIVDLLASPPQDTPDGQRIHQEMAVKIRSVLNDQRLATLDTLFALSDGLKEMKPGGATSERLLALAAELHEFEMPRPIFTKSEKISWAPKVYSSHHAELQVKTDLTKVIKGSASRSQLDSARGLLIPFLRDTLVGLNYAYYEPPGAQVLHNNPLFVRSHDFSGMSIIGADRPWRAPVLMGVGTPAGGGAYLMGSLADLSYALAMTEQDFIAPENVQALIWKELAPALLVSATLPRWWTVSPNELRAVALYQKGGEELLIAAVKDPPLREKVIDILSDRMAPQRLDRISQSLQRGEAPAVMLPRMMPAETFYLAVEFRQRFPTENASLGKPGLELDTLSQRYPAEVGWNRLSRDFGVPHPTLARTNARELLNMEPVPFFGGYSSRLFGESWESGNLYWARLADELGYPPVMLNRLVPELTLRMTAKIFATELEDWPAMLRAMQETGQELRQGKVAALPLSNTTISRTEPPAAERPEK